MRLMFVYWNLADAGSAHTIRQYARTGARLGHEIVLYGPPDGSSRIACSLDAESADAVIFVLEWNIYLHQNRPLDLDGPLRGSSRERRIVIDNDGMYNDVVRVDGDYNHPAVEDSRRRTELYESIADRIYQPTLHPLRPNVGSFLFHAYDPGSEVPLDLEGKRYGMVYVGSNWFRWRPMARLLGAIEPIRKRVGAMRLVGHDWGETPWWIESPLREDAYRTDPEYLRRLEVEIAPAVPIERVIPTMSDGLFNPVLARSTFNHLRLAHPRLFETPAAATIPLFDLDEEHVREIYGDAAVALVLGDEPTELIADVLTRPDRYGAIVAEIRRSLAERHSFEARLQELIEIVRSPTTGRGTAPACG